MTQRPTLIPRLFAPDAEALAEFIKTIFGATGEIPSGRPAELRLGDSLLMVSDGRPPMPAAFYLHVADADDTFARAVAAGAEAVEPPAETPWGHRRATVRDRWGNLWQVATPRE